MTELQPFEHESRFHEVLLRLCVVVPVIALVIGQGMYFAVQEGTAVVVTRFGRPLGALVEPGPSWKWPWPVDQAHVVDRRLKLFDTPFTATLTRDKKTVILLTYVAWRAEDPLLFLQAAGDADSAEKKLSGMVTAAKNLHMGKHDLEGLLSVSGESLEIASIEEAILREVRAPAREKFGISVEQVGFKRIAFPEENTPAVLQHMRSERRAVASRLRAEGERNARALRNEAMVKAEEILTQGRTEAGTIRGRAEKQAAAIYAEAHRLDPNFYRFWRSLEALKSVLGEQSTLVLRSDQAFFEVLSDSPGGARKQGENGRSPLPEAGVNGHQ